MRVVVNASPLILLVKVKQLELLPAVASEIVVPRVVVDELDAGEFPDRAAKLVAQASWSRIAHPPSTPTEISAWDLGAGESAVLTWASTYSGTTAVLDDQAARKCAEAVGLPFIGTLGIILAAKEAGLIVAARPILEELVQAGYYISEAIFATALRKIGE